MIARVLSLQTGKSLVESDFIATNKCSELLGFIITKSSKILQGDATNTDSLYKLSEVDGTFFGKQAFAIEKDGIRWYIPPYFAYCGAVGIVDVLITWNELLPFFNSQEYLNQFRKLHASSYVIRRCKE